MTIGPGYGARFFLRVRSGSGSTPPGSATLVIIFISASDKNENSDLEFRKTGSATLVKSFSNGFDKNEKPDPDFQKTGSATQPVMLTKYGAMRLIIQNGAL